MSRQHCREPPVVTAGPSEVDSAATEYRRLRLAQDATIYADRFDALSRTLTKSGSRRTTLRALLGTLFGGALLDPSADSLGKGHGKKPRKASRGKHDDHQPGERKRRTERRADRDPARNSGQDRNALQEQRSDAVEVPLAPGEWQSSQ